MNHEDVEKIIVEQGNQARERQTTIKRLIYATWVYVLALTAVFTLLFMNATGTISEQATTISEQATTLTDQAAVLNRRSPVLEYLQCHNELLGVRNKAQTEHVFAVIDADSPPTAEQNKIIITTRKNYADAEKNLAELKGCPKELPS